jgi:hypothetical protein
MKLAAGAPTHWRVRLLDGSEVQVWAHSVEGLAGDEDTRDYKFENLMDIAVEEQGEFDIGGRTPSNPERVLVTVAIFPRSAVKDIL